VSQQRTLTRAKEPAPRRIHSPGCRHFMGRDAAAGNHQSRPKTKINRIAQGRPDGGVRRHDSILFFTPRISPVCTDRRLVTNLSREETLTNEFAICYLSSHSSPRLDRGLVESVGIIPSPESADLRLLLCMPVSTETSPIRSSMKCSIVGRCRYCKQVAFVIAMCLH
jgi:hypothetical protein